MRCSTWSKLMNHLTRRTFLQGHLGLGGLALLDLLAGDAYGGSAPEDPLAPRSAHLPAKAQRCIFLFMEGGVSQMDTFEFRPALVKNAGKQMPVAKGTVGEIATFSA